MMITWNWFLANVVALELFAFGLLILSTIVRTIVSDIREMFF